jgi:hypothetical protein
VRQTRRGRSNRIVSLFDYSSNYNCIEQEMIKTDIV